MSRYDDNLELERIFTGSDAKSDLGGFLHEMKPHLEIIAGYTALLKKRYEGTEPAQPSEEFAEWLDKIAWAADDLRRLRDAAISAWKNKR
jgi:hypothetical protein